MAELMAMWLPIVLAAAGVFVVSSVLHMVVAWHKGDAGKMAGEYGKELKNVPDEFKKGYDEKQSDIRAKKAKQMDPVPKEMEGSE